MEMITSARSCRGHKAATGQAASHEKARLEAAGVAVAAALPSRVSGPVPDQRRTDLKRHGAGNG